MSQIIKYILLISLVLNGILIMFVIGMVPFFLYLSIIINLILCWYSSKCLLTINDTENDMIHMLRKNEDFLDELENIHSLEMYYGDEYLQNLINNSRKLVNEFIDTQEKYFDVEVAEEDDNEDNNEDSNEEDASTAQEE